MGFSGGNQRGLPHRLFIRIVVNPELSHPPTHHRQAAAAGWNRSVNFPEIVTHPPPTQQFRTRKNTVLFLNKKRLQPVERRPFRRYDDSPSCVCVYCCRCWLVGGEHKDGFSFGSKYNVARGKSIIGRLVTSLQGRHRSFTSCGVEYEFFAIQRHRIDLSPFSWSTNAVELSGCGSDEKKNDFFCYDLMVFTVSWNVWKSYFWIMLW